MQKMMMNENELASRCNISPKTLQRWRSEGRGPRFMKISKRVVYPIDEVFDFESQALRSATWESASDVVLPNGSKLVDAREISYVTGLPLYIFTQRQMREALGIPHRRVQKLIRFDRDEVMV
ncbi:helix-turn-helix transcriptional regulator [Burkholderia gladioli]|uniref:helix-turn-helix transcriptional regulator n=1 Tax=Burkholderia gladioli TaxID=28095 RepID=UPI00069CE344|nr:helix-turn-helix domain-containing protein [Burkholderia gladioli]MDA0575893.1 helix-turn-helix domain-containing protein [Burkholderia gladioli]MDA0604106.1 helix-turn-helix domain-containing protein [Burkholderia gladioli]